MMKIDEGISMRMIATLFTALILFAPLTLLGAEKVILITLSSEQAAQTELQRLETKISKADMLKEWKVPYTLAVRPSGKYHVIVADIEGSLEQTRHFADIMRKSYPGAFIVKPSPETAETAKPTAAATPQSAPAKPAPVKKAAPKPTPAKASAVSKPAAKPAAPAPGGRTQVNINLSNLAIDDFIKLIAKITKKNILVNHKVNGTVNLVTSTPVYDDEVMGILISVLESKGFTLVQNGSVYEVVRATDAARSNLKVVRPDHRAYGSLMVTQAVPVTGANVDVVASKVRYMISKNAKLMTLKETNTMLVTDYPGNIETVKRVISDLGRSINRTMKIVPVEYADVKQLHGQLTNIAKGLFDPKIESDQVTILQNAETGSIILIGPRANVAELEGIIASLDKEKNLEEEVQIVNLKNSDAKTVLASLTEIVSKQTFADPTLKPNISANEEINAIILVGNPSVIKGLRRILDELDKEKFQVYVQARIVEINNEDTEKIGLQYGIEAGKTTPAGIYTFAGNFGGSSVALSETVQSLVVSDMVDQLGNIDKFLALGAALDFLQTKGASKTVSNPSILCVNNQESSIYVGKTISFQTGETTGTVGTTSSFKREDVGLTLKIKPRVSSADKVTLDVETVLENVAGYDSVTSQPTTTKQNVTTQAILRHGESIIIGGLVKTYETETVSKVPILGYIPLLGMLFTHTEATEQQDNLMVLLTPYIIDKSEDLSTLQVQLGELGRLQSKYNETVFPQVEERENATQDKAAEK